MRLEAVLMLAGFFAAQQPSLPMAPLAPAAGKKLDETIEKSIMASGLLLLMAVGVVLVSHPCQRWTLIDLPVQIYCWD